MAAVKITQTLKTELIAAATAPFNKIIVDEKQRITSNPEFARLAIIELTSQEEFDMAMKLGKKKKGWINETGNSVHVKLGKDTLALKTDAWPNPFSMWAGHQGIVNSVSAPVTHAMLQAESVTLMRAETDAANLTKALTTLLDSCPSFNKAVEAMPALLDWAPAEIKERYNSGNVKRVKDTQTPAEKFAEAFGDEANVAALARSRMS